MTSTPCTYDFQTCPTTFPHNLSLPHTTFDLYTPCPRLSRPAHVYPGLPMSIPASLRLSRPPHVYPGLPMSIPASPRLSRPPHVYPGLPTSIPASPTYPEREKNINCLEIEGEYHVMLRCNARRFLSNDSFAEALTDSRWP